MTKPELIKRCEELGIDHEPLTNNEQRKAAIDAKEAELAKEAQDSSNPLPEEVSETESEDPQPEDRQRQAPIDEKEAEPAKGSQLTNNPLPKKDPETDPENPQSGDEDDPEVQEAPRTYFQDNRGRKWVFKENAPKTLNFEGQNLTQEEIMQDETIIAQLVYGQNSFLKQIATWQNAQTQSE